MKLPQYLQSPARITVVAYLLLALVVLPFQFSSNEVEEETDTRPSQPVQQQARGCSALSCGEPGVPNSTVTCLKEQGCFCNADRGCATCKKMDDVCETTRDCCGEPGLYCRTVTLGTGELEKRCIRPRE